MKTKTLNYLILIILALIFIVIAAIVLIGIFEKTESEFGGLKEITGTTQTYEITLKSSSYKPEKDLTSERYDDMYLEYLDNKQESRDKTFFR